MGDPRAAPPVSVYSGHKCPESQVPQYRHRGASLGLAMDAPWYQGRVSSSHVLGIDACASGWCGVLLAGRDVSVCQADGIDALVRQLASPLAVVAVDMPIGLADDRPRAPDLAARKLIGPRASSVFSTPVRDALEASTHAEATLVSRERTGRGVSAQAFALRSKIFEVEHWAHAAPCRGI